MEKYSVREAHGAVKNYVFEAFCEMRDEHCLPFSWEGLRGFDAYIQSVCGGPVLRAYRLQAKAHGWPVTLGELLAFGRQVRKGLRVAPTYEYAFARGFMAAAGAARRAV